MISRELAYHAPASLDEAIALLGDGDEHVELLAGGMSLVPTMTLGLASPDAVVSLKRVGGLSHVTVTDTEVRLGAMVTHAEIAASPQVRRALGALSECAALIGDVQIRNRGTVGGSLAHADPAANYPPLALALGATMVVRSAAGERLVHADDYFRGFMETAVGEGDVLTEVRVPRLEAGAAASYMEFVRVEGNFALVNACAAVAPDRSGGTLALGGVGPVPVKVALGPVLEAGSLDVAALDRLIDAVTTDVFVDINGTADYKRALARTFGRRAVVDALDRVRAGGAPA